MGCSLLKVGARRLAQALVPRPTQRYKDPMTIPGRFEGKVVAVTGAARGFGEAIARRFAAEGARVVLGDVDEAAVARTSEAAGGRARFRLCDVAAAADVEALVGAAVEGDGGLDVMVNNAGFSHRSMPLWDLPEA